MITEEKLSKWESVIDHPKLEKITDPHRRNVLTQLLENTEKELTIAEEWNPQRLLQESPIPGTAMRASSSTPGDGAIDLFDPVLVSMVRRSMPNLIAYDICGVQPMTGPAGLVFAIRARLGNTSGAETMYDEVDTSHSTVVGDANTLGDKHVGTLPGNSTVSSNLAEQGLYNYGDAMSTAQSEALGTDSNTAWPEISLSIEKVSVEAKARKLKATYTAETAQDMRAIHGLEAERELSQMMAAQVMAEINREIVRTIYVTAKQGSVSGRTTTNGRFDLDTDANGRWAAEKFKGLGTHIEFENNKIAKDTRMGKGNIILCSSDVASALQAAGDLDYAPAQASALQVDDTGPTFAGMFRGRVKVFVDPYAVGDFFVAGYKGNSPMHAGLFYCPYVPLQMVRAVGQDDFHPRIGYMTRYGVVANPFAQGSTQGNGALLKDSNVFYRRTLIDNLM